MAETLGIGFKEWAAICTALAAGRQAIILRKGGIAEAGGEFQVEHHRFWLYPTFQHQKPEGLTADGVAFLRQSEAARPPAGWVRLSHWVEVRGIYHLHDLASALKLEGLHLWSRETIQARFHYRSPGLYLLVAAVHRAPQMIEVQETAEQAGCRSWVPLDPQPSIEGSTPVLGDAELTRLRRILDELLRPTAWV
jgi:hypothetical protein